MLRRYSVRLWIYPWFMKYLNTPGTCERHRLGLNFQQNISDHLRVHSTKPEGLYITSVLLVLDWAERWVLCVAPYFFQVDAYSWMLAWLHFEYRSAFCCWCIYLLHYLTAYFCCRKCQYDALFKKIDLPQEEVNVLPWASKTTSISLPPAARNKPPGTWLLTFLGYI